MAIMKQMSGQLTHGSAGDYQADERAGVAWLSCLFQYMLDKEKQYETN